MISDWPAWWRALPRWRKVLPAATLVPYLFVLHALDGLRGDHWLIVGILLALSYGGRKFGELLKFLLPLAIMGIVYDSQRLYGDLIRGPVHVTEPYDFDMRFFGIETPEGRLIPSQWLQKRTHRFLDLITGLAYLAYIAEFVVVAAWYAFRKSRTGTSKRTAEWVRAYAPRLMWAFLGVNLLGFSTYYWYAASPPWYVELYGFGPARIDVPPSAAGGLRFDAITGTKLFAGMYGQSANVHGAIPSLHVAYPLMAVYYSFRIGSLRAFSVIFWALMSFAAVYLNHHYVIDVLLGWVYGLTAVLIADAWCLRKAVGRGFAGPARDPEIN